MLFGYARVSTSTQNLELQIEALIKEGVKEKNIYTDVASGIKSTRNGLDKLLEKLREEDTLIVWKIDRIARSLSHLLKLVDDFGKNEINFKSIQEPFIDTTSSHGKFVLSLFGAFAQLERDIIVERTIAGQNSARRRGAQIGRRKGLSKEAQKKAILAESYYRDEKNNLSITEIMKLVGASSKATLYKYLDIQGKRKCQECKTIFWDKNQDLELAYCEQHIKQKEKKEYVNINSYE